MITISGTNVLERGECVGFRIQTEGFDVQSPRVYFGANELAPSFYYVLDADTVQVGFPCFYTSLGLPLGPLSVTLREDGRELSLAGAFEVVQTTRLDIGETPATSEGLVDADANLLGADYDFDVYDWSVPAPGLLLAEVVVASGGDPAFLPYTYVAHAGLNPSWNGHELVLIPAAEGDHLAQISDDRIQGGNGFRYTLEVAPLGAPLPLDAGDTCDAMAAVTTAGLFTLDLTAAASDFDPSGIESCADRHVPQPPLPGEGVSGAGPERVVRLVVGSGETLSVAVRGDVTDAVLYLLDDAGPNGCTAPPAPCLAAADTFGANDTETLRWANGGAARTVWLVVDEFGGNDSDPGEVTVFIRADPGFGP